MTTKNNAFLHATEAAFMDWKARYHKKMQNPRTLFEQAVIQMLSGWEWYALAHQATYKSHILNDGVLGECWSAIGEALLGLLNGELGRLDGGTLDRAIRNLLEPKEDDEDASASDAAPEEEKEETDFKGALSLCEGDKQ